MKEINKQDIEKSNSWPIVEAKKILKERKSFIEKKGKIVLQTGYGPSGLPHIGTFGEVARTSMVVNALNLLTDLPKEIITFTDDMDCLRKVPDNVPNKIFFLLHNFLKPLRQTSGITFIPPSPNIVSTIIAAVLLEIAFSKALWSPKLKWSKPSTFG